MADRGTVILLAAADRAAMAGQLRAIRDGAPSPPPSDQPCRLAVIVDDPAEMATRLDQAAARLAKDDKPRFNLAGRILYAEHGRPGHVALLFPGFGAHHPTMMEDLVAGFAPARAWLDTLPAAAQARLNANPLLFPSSNHGPADFAQTIDAALAGSLALARVVRALVPGLAPQAMVGHSYGEMALLLESGMAADPGPVLSLLPALIARIAARGAAPVAMLAVNAAGLDRLGAAAQPLVALANCPQQTVLCGAPAVLAAMEDRLRRAGLACFRLPELAIAVHTPAFPVSGDELAALYATIALGPARVTAYSAATAAPFPASPDAVRAVLAGQWSHPVRFADTIRAMEKDGIDTFVEVGAGGHLTGFVRDILRGRPVSAIAANQDGRPTIAQLRLLVAQMFVTGMTVDPMGLGRPAAPPPPIATTAAVPARTDTVEALLRRLVADILDLDGAELIDAERGFFDLGMGSVQAVELIDRAAAALDRPLAQTLAFDFPSIAALAAHLRGDTGRTGMTGPRPDRDGSVAIIGIGCRLPGGIDDMDTFWDLLSAGRSAIGAVPAERWALDHLRAAGIDPDGMAHIFRAGCLDEIRDFDPGFFGISPREATTLDPQQRLLLEVAHEALEHAAIAPSSVRGSATAIFVGISNADYAQRLTMTERLAVGGYVGTGNTNSTAAGRLAFVLGTHGPALAVDTACSSSLVALHLAARALADGETNLALAGGVNLLVSPETSVFLARAGALSPTGQCHTFDAEADGYVRGEGAGMVVLKRLDDAIRDGDPVLAVIRGSAVNHDGRTSGFTVPNGPAQQALIGTALAVAGLDADAVDVLEAHGTGTALGDPIEAHALGAVFAGRPADRPLWLGSAKTNLGHLEAAAGMVGLIKMVLQLGHGRIAPSLNFTHPNPRIHWQGLPLAVAAQARPWPDKPGGRVGAVSSFGISGTNAHVVLSPAPPAAGPVAALPARSHHLLTLSAKSPTALARLIQRTAPALPADPAGFADACATRMLGRDHHACRLAVVAADGDEARARLARTVPAAARPVRLAFVYGGQGAQCPGMGADLYAAEPVFRAALDACAAALAPHLDRPLAEILWGDADLADTRNTQPALFAVELALTRLLADWGIRPDMVVGHSIGEFAAACAAGMLDLDDAARMVAARGRLMGALPAGGAMLGAALSEAEATALLDRHGLRLDIAAINAARSVTLAGTAAEIDRAAGLLTAHGTRWRRLEVSHAFHSALMDPVLPRFAPVCAATSARPATTPMISTVTGQPLTAPADGAYWTRQVRAPVRFAAALARARADGAGLFVEIGPRPVLSVPGQAEDPSAQWLAAQIPTVPGQRQIQEVAATLYTAGRAVDGAALWRDRPHAPYPLPATPFDRRRLWIEPGQPAPAAASLVTATPAPSGPAPSGPAPAPAPIVVQLRETAPDRRAAVAQDYLSRLVATILGGARADSLDPAVPLNRLGLDSLMALGLRNELIADFALDLSLSRLTGDDTSLASLTRAVLDRLFVPAPPAGGPDEAGPDDGDGPLSYGQRALWYLWRLAPDSSAYTLSLPLAVPAPADPGAWRAACAALLDAHPALRTVFPAPHGQPVQRVTPPHAPDWRETDATGWDDDALAAALAAAHAQPFDLDAGPVVRFHWFDRGDAGAALLICLHHIVGDGWSLEIIRRQLPAAAAGQAVAATGGPLPAIRRHLARLAGPEGDRLWTHWRDLLTPPPPPLELPTRRPRPAAKGFVGAAHVFTLPDDVADGLKSLGRSVGATPYVAFLTAFLVLLHRVSGQDDLAVGSPQAGRDHPDLAGLVGYFVDPLVVRSRLDQDMGLRDLMAATRHGVAAGLDHAAFPFALLVERLNPARAANRSPLFDASFNFIAHVPDQGGARVIDLAQADGKFDLTLNVQDGARVRCWFGYDVDLFDADDIARLADTFVGLLRSALARPGHALAALADAPGTPVLAGPTLPLGPADMVPALVAARAAAWPDETAIVAADASPTRAHLARGCATLARRLTRAGIGRGDRVGVPATRDAATIAAFLAVMATGAAFVPLDPLWPVRLRDDLIARHRVVLVLDQDGLDRLPADDGLPTTCPARPEDPAYVLFTSGSTGTPKGVVVPHRALANYLAGMAPLLGLDRGGHFALASTLAADLGLTMVLPALCLGGTLHLIDEATALDGPAFAAALRQRAIDHLKIVPSHLAALNAAGPALPAKTLVLGGEPVAPGIAAGWAAARPDLRIFNHYGPTETTIGIACAPVGASDGWTGASLALDRTIANTRLYLLDRHDRPVLPGAVGQVFVAGAALALEYADSDQPLGRVVGGERLYPTGDLARQDPAGRLEILGRADRQIKIRGQRLEPGQLETLLLAQPGIAQAAVIADHDGARASRILAFAVAPPDGGAVDEGAVLRAVAPVLPAALVPDHLHLLPALPLTGNGKTDVAALRAIAATATGTAVRPGLPRDRLELDLAALWAEALELPVADVGIDDDFFRMGGHSLLAVKVLAWIEIRFGRKLPLATLVTHPTVKALAPLLRDGPTGPAPVLVALAPGAATAVPLLLLPGAGGSLAYLLPLARHLGGKRAVWGLNALGQDDSPVPATVEDSAGRYADAIAALWPDGPVALAGHSFGALVAFELAGQLEARGVAVTMLGLIDNRAPDHDQPVPDRSPCGWLRHVGLRVAKLTRTPLPAGLIDGEDYPAAMTALVGHLVANALLPADADPAGFHRFVEIYRANAVAAARFRPDTPLPPGPTVAVIRAGLADADLDEVARAPSADLGWSRLLAAPARVMETPGTHLTMFDAVNAPALAARLEALLSPAGAEPPP